MNTDWPSTILSERNPAGDVDYDTHGQGYVNKRRPDPYIAAWVHKALGAARTVLETGIWDRKFGEWRTKPYFEGSLRLIVGNSAGRD